MDRGERSWTEIASRALSSLVQNPVEVNEGALQRTSDELDKFGRLLLRARSGVHGGRKPGTKLATKARELALARRDAELR